LRIIQSATTFGTFQPILTDQRDQDIAGPNPIFDNFNKVFPRLNCVNIHEDLRLAEVGA
jgi:hypothetical protein